MDLRPSRELVWHLSTLVNDGLLSIYITIFDPMRVKRRRFIPFLVYAQVYLSIASNLVTFATLSPWSDSLCTLTCSPFAVVPYCTIEYNIFYILLNLYKSSEQHTGYIMFIFATGAQLKQPVYVCIDQQLFWEIYL